MNLKIAIDSVECWLTPVRGEPIEVALYFHPREGSPAAPLVLRRQLNDPEALFLPCEVEGRPRLVRVDWIAYLTFDTGLGTTMNEEDILASRADVSLDLVTGANLAGTLLYHGRPGDRVSDYLNSMSYRFLQLRNEDGAHEVNRSAVEQILF
jgi:hypothetical protein